MNIDQFLNDTIEVTTLLKKEFQKDKIVLVGHSWGSVLGMLAIHKHPEHFSHYIGVSQVTSMSIAEELSYELVLEKANELNNQKALKQLTEIGKPPWNNLKHDGIHQKYLDLFGGGISHDRKLVKEFVKKLLKSKEYTIFDVVNHVKGQMFSMKNMINELRSFEMKDVIHNVKVPVTFIAGKYDLQVPPLPAKEFFDHLQAPSKEWVVFEKSAHSPNYEEKDQFIEKVLEIVSRY